MNKLKQARDLIRKRPHLVWYTRNFGNLSEKSIVESVLNYGNWQDYLSLEKIFGAKRLKTIFEELKSQKRANLRRQTINYFSNYFARNV